jgi:tRNA pseudouridine(38-40) synthase
MAENTGTATSGMPAKRHSSQDTPQSSPKRIKVDLRATAGASPPDSNADIPQSNKNSQKKRDAAGYPKSRQGKEKDDKNVGRRRRGHPGRNEVVGAAEATEADPRDVPVAEKAPRLPKRQSAILLGFCGTGCAGMQMSVSDCRVGKSILTMLYSQPDARTIEGVLFEALVRVGAVSSDNADDPTKVSLGRAARTDAGVHAAGNLVSLKLITQIPGVSDIIAAVNKLLPPEIRIWGIVRAQNSFNARTYVYFSLKRVLTLTRNIDLAIVASTRTFSLPTFLYHQSLAVVCMRRSVARRSHRRTAYPTPAHSLATSIRSGLSLLPSHQRMTIYEESVDGALEQRMFGDYEKSLRSSRVLAISTTLL